MFRIRHLIPCLGLCAPVFAHDKDPDHGSHRLHFSHPIITESPSTDTKVRFDVEFEDEAGGTATTFGVDAEYAFHETFSIEVGLPYTFLDEDGATSESDLGNVEVAFKFANLEFEDRGLLLGYGLELGFPTGSDESGIGSSHIFEFAPFLDFGYKCEDLEFVGFTTFGIPTNQNDADEVETDLSIQLSSLYHLDDSWMGLLELDASSPLSGDEDGNWFVNLHPGVKYAPCANLKLGLSYGFDLGNRSELDSRIVFSAFYHL